MTNRHRALWSLPILVILSFLWYKRKRSGTSSDPGGTGERTGRRGEKSSSDQEEEVLLGGDKVVRDPVPKNGSSEICAPEVGSGEAYRGLVDLATQDGGAIGELEEELCVVKDFLTSFAHHPDSEGETAPLVREEVVRQEVETVPAESFECPVEVDSRTEVGSVTAEDAEERDPEASDSVKPEEEEAEGETPLAKEEEEEKAAEQELLLVGAMATDEDVRTDEKPTRDSANHSPAEVMLGSPSASSFSDEGSSDSGKGCSDVATPPSRTPVGGGSVSGDAPGPSVYEFVLPQTLVGKLIGRHGAFVQQIKAKTNASVLIKRHPDTSKLKICAVEGSQMDIENALEMIRKKFPLKMFPSMTLEQVYFVPPVPTVPVLPDCLQCLPGSFCCSPFQWYPSCLAPFHILSLSLVEGVNNDVILSSLVSPSHFFLQQPTHPTFPSLNRLNTYMNVCYSEPSAPLLPTPVDVGIICVAPAMGGWFRAQVVSTDPDRELYEVKFVDYGGYLSLEHSALRQIRTDFMTLPFQASECYLANVMPVGGSDVWSPEAMTAMEELTQGQVLQAQVLDYAQDGVPIVVLCAIHSGQVVLVNQELVNRGVAEWCAPVSEEEA